MAPDTITPTKTEPVFFSACENLRLVRAQEIKRTLDGGIQMDVSPGIAVQFEGGYFRVTDVARKRHRRFFKEYGHVYGADQYVELEEWLRKHPNFRRQGEGGFVEIAPLVPDPGPTLEEITDAVIDADADRLAEILAAEEDGHQREAVLNAASRALASLSKAKAPAGG